MAESGNDGSLAPRRGLGGPILPPPPPELAEDARAEERSAAADSENQIARDLMSAQKATAAQERTEQKARAKQERASRPARTPRPAKGPKPAKPKGGPAKQGSPRRTRRAQLRLVQVDAWSVMKTSFLLSIALGIVLVVAVAIIWSVLGAAGVWESINSIVQQAVGGDNSKPFDIQEYAGTSRVLGFTMIVAVLDVILITAIATLGAFLYNLSAALLGGIEVTLAEDN
ncbi:MAG: hypothetical protein JWR85_850 [Marmoricola sp.]|nr:hypothetical protein [Marmoricola sp.]